MENPVGLRVDVVGFYYFVVNADARDGRRQFALSAFIAQVTTRVVRLGSLSFIDRFWLVVDACQ